MALEKASLDGMIARIASQDINLYNILSRLNGQVGALTDLINPLQASVASLSAPEAAPGQVLVFNYELRPLSVHFVWEAPDTRARIFELRQGTVWETADFILRTPSLSADINPIAVGTTTYLLKAINADNIYSTDAATLAVVVPSIGPMSLTGTVIDNNVLLSWSTPTSSFQLDYYIFSKQKGSDPFVEVGRLRNNFTTTFETASDTYTYKIVPVDVAGNLGPETTIIKDVRKPPDFELLTEFDSDLTGTKVNCIVYNNTEGTPILVACVDTSETWQDHYIDNGYNTPQDQIDDGFPYYLQPTPLTCYYEETVDLGTEISNVVVNLSWGQNQIVGTTTVSCEMSGSTDGVTFSTPEPGTSIFFQTVRYIKFRLTFTAADDTALIELFNLHGAVDVKKEVDSGEVPVYAADADGTLILFNKDFKDVDSLTCTAQSVQPIDVVKTFVDEPNPIGFRARAYDSAGIRIDMTVSWKARGIV